MLLSVEVNVVPGLVEPGAFGGKVPGELGCGSMDVLQVASAISNSLQDRAKPPFAVDPPIPVQLQQG